MAENTGGASFRGAVVGGFYRQDVLDYIENAAKEHKREVDALKEEIRALSDERDGLKKTLSEMQSASKETEAKNTGLWQELAAATDEAASKQKRMDELTKELSSLREQVSSLTSELAEKSYELEKLTKESGFLQSKLAMQEKILSDFAESKQRVADIELKAYERAADIREEAAELGKAALTSLNRAFSDTKNTFDATKGDSVRTILDIVSDLDRLKDGLIALSRRFDGFGDNFILGLEEEIDVFISRVADERHSEQLEKE
ncbi:hypothetical protein LJC34_01445 [Oscillospiraceae bacterium OttesenSCG-928-G22]|nr:hypothetical protein [Oscillospiraceae bacterium OttesenSCG-928-G22]